MSLVHKTKIYKPSSTKNPMHRLDTQYDHLLTSERLQKKTWMLLTLLGMTYVVASLFLFKYAIELPKTVPMVIEVSSWGEAKYMGDVSSYSYNNITIPETAKEWQIKEFIKKLDTISSDRQIVYDNATNIFKMITKACAQKVRDNFNNEKVFELIGKKTVYITKFESVLKISADSYQIDWYEQTTGQNAGTRRYRGIFTLKILNPTEKQQDINPLGLFISNYDISEIKEK